MEERTYIAIFLNNADKKEKPKLLEIPVKTGKYEKISALLFKSDHEAI